MRTKEQEEKQLLIKRYRDEQNLIEKHLNKHDGGWWRILDRYTTGILILWGRENRQWEKFIKFPASMIL